jgi:hypothetical protein
MAANPNVPLIVGVSAVTFAVGTVLVFSNHPIGRALVILSVVGLVISLRDPNEIARNRKRGRDAWFGLHRIGFGWGPRNWKGWAVVAAAMVLVAFALAYVGGNR